MMLEFLKECGPNELYERAKDCELNLKSFNPYTPMASLFETTLKTEFYKYFPYERFNKKIDPSLLDLLANDDFTDKYTQDFFFDKKSLEVIDKIRKESNRFKHRDSQKTKPSENDVRECFKCLYSFCAGIYKASMCKPAPAWSDSEYDKLIINLLDNDKRHEEIIFTNEDVNRRNMLLKQNAKSLNSLLSDKFSIILLILAIVIAVAFVTATILNKTNDISKENAAFAAIESSVVEQPTVIQTQPKSGEIYLDVFADKGSEGIFTNELDYDVIVSCYYPKTGETVLEFYLRQGDTITMDMPYASLIIYAKDTNGNELFAVTDKTAFTLGESIPIIISKN